MQGEDSEQLFEVERIVGKKLEHGKVLYKIKWKQFTDEDCTWEVVSHLRYVPELIY